LTIKTRFGCQDAPGSNLCNRLPKSVLIRRLPGSLCKPEGLRTKTDGLKAKKIKVDYKARFRYFSRLGIHRNESP